MRSTPAVPRAERSPGISGFSGSSRGVQGACDVEIGCAWGWGSLNEPFFHLRMRIERRDDDDDDDITVKNKESVICVKAVRSESLKMWQRGWKRQEEESETIVHTLLSMTDRPKCYSDILVGTDRSRTIAPIPSKLSDKCDTTLLLLCRSPISVHWSNNLE